MALSSEVDQTTSYPDLDPAAHWEISDASDMPALFLTDAHPHGIPGVMTPEERDKRAAEIMIELENYSAMPEEGSFPPDSPDYTN